MGLSEAFYERVMANVNLKVMMRIGDNRTASDMTEWFGKVASTKRSVGTGMTSSVSSGLFKGPIDLNSRRMGGESQSVSISEDEEDLVSAEELKHEMSAEKGLAWFDLGNGRIVKGRSFWFNANLPETWEGREFIVHPEKFEVDEIGLSDWVDEKILSQEQEETSAKFATQPRLSPEAPAPNDRKGAPPKPSDVPSVDSGAPFKLDLSAKGGRARGSVTALAAPKDPPPTTQPGKKGAPGKNTNSGPPKAGPKTGPFKFRK
jgi:hypothetical protein